MSDPSTVNAHLEHVKAFVGEVLDAFHHGESGLHGKPITLGIAKLLIWDEIEHLIMNSEAWDWSCSTVRFRLAGPSSEAVEAVLAELRPMIGTARCIGPRARSVPPPTSGGGTFVEGDASIAAALASLSSTALGAQPGAQPPPPPDEWVVYCTVLVGADEAKADWLAVLTKARQHGCSVRDWVYYGV